VAFQYTGCKTPADGGGKKKKKPWVKCRGCSRKHPGADGHNSYRNTLQGRKDEITAEIAREEAAKVVPLQPPPSPPARAAPCHGTAHTNLQNKNDANAGEVTDASGSDGHLQAAWYPSDQY